MAGVKPPCPSELRQEGEKIASKMANIDEWFTDLDKDNKRWLIIGIVINTVMTPALRDYVKTKMDQLYQTLNNSNNIASQQYPKQMQFHSGTFLNYEAINNNKTLGRQQQKHFDYDVKNSVDLSKLFMETNMAKYLAIDESCDLSALLGIIIKSGISPVSARQCADKLRDKVRNPWAHCMYSVWDETKYIESFKIMEQLVNDLGFPTQEEKDLITNLHKWKNSGNEFIENKTTKILTEVTKEIRDLIKYAEVIAVDTPEEICKLKEELVKMETILLNHADRIHQLEQTTSGHSGKIDALENCIPSNIRAQHKIHIDEWKKYEDMFTFTRATKHVTELVKTNEIVMVTGSSGSGKSTILHHVALQLQQKFEVIPFILSPDDIIRYRDVKKNQLFVVDDFCGKNFISENDLGNWKNHMEKIEKLFPSDTINEQTQEGKLKILIACRLQIFKDEEVKRLKMFTKQVVDLHSNEYCLITDEKKNMIEKYTGLTLSKSDFQKMEEMLKNCTYFPILCKMSAGKQVDQMFELFSSPIDSIRQDIQEMMQSNNKFEFCALVLCVLFPDGFHEEFMKPRLTSKKVKQKTTKIVKIFEIDLENELHRKQLASAFNQMNGTYIKKIGRKFSISHDMLYDMVSVTCGQELVELFIDFAPSSFIAEQCRFSSVFTDQSLKQDESFVYLPVDTETIYFHRVLEDLKNNDVSSLFFNRQLKNSMYRGKVMRYILQNKDACKQVFIKLDRTGIKQRHKFAHYKSYLTTPLIEATKAGVYELIEFLIQCKLNVNKMDSIKHHPLFYAYTHGFMNIVDLLISNGVNDNDTMYWACYYGDSGRVAKLISQNVGVSKCRFNSTHLHAACERGHTDIVRLLLDRNVDMSQFGRYKKSPLYAACMSGHTDIVQLLLDRNVDVSQSGLFGRTPLLAACERGHTDIVQLLLDRNVDVSQSGLFGRTPLLAACERGHTDIVQLLLDRNVDVSQSGLRGKTPLYAACMGGHTDIVQLLLDRNVDVSQTSSLGTPLYGACEGGHIDIVKLLLDRNVDVSQTSSLGDPPLYAACERGHIDIVQLLLDRNVNVSQPGRCGKTPLYAACKGGHTDIVQLLLDRNVDVSQHGEDRETPLLAACEGGHTSIVQLLIDRNVDVSRSGLFGRTPLLAACERGHTDIVQLLLNRNVDVSQSGLFGETPLYAACMGGHTDIVQLLLDRNVDVSQSGLRGVTPLYAACKGGHTDIVQLLLDRNVDMSQSDRYGRTPLYAACEGGHTDIVQLLLDRNVDMSQSDRYGRTPLHAACEEGHTDIVQLLLDRNVDMPQPGLFGRTPLYAACIGGHTDIVQLLLDRNVDVLQSDRYGRTPLHAACMGGHTDIVQFLLDRNVDVSQTSSLGDPPLYDACERGHTDIVQLLLDRNVNVSQPGRRGKTPLYAACKGGHTDIVQLLLDRNVNVSQHGADRETPLYAACERGHTDIVQLLLDRNVDVSQSGLRGVTPLYAACIRGHTDIVQLLLDRNVNVSQSGLRGVTPLYAACERGHTDIVQLLLDRNVDVSQSGLRGVTPLYAACIRGHTDIVQLLLNRNVNVSQSGWRGKTPLYAACISGHTDIVQLLLDRNVNVSQSGWCGKTPLYAACMRGHTDIVQLLLDRNVDVSQSGLFGRTPLLAACERGHTDIVQLLLDRNVDVSQPDRRGKTPLYVACHGGHTDIVQLLLDRNIDVSQTSPLRDPPLYVACKGGHADIVQLLLDRNVDVDLSRKIMGQTILDVTTETIKDLLMCHQMN